MVRCIYQINKGDTNMNHDMEKDRIIKALVKRGMKIKEAGIKYNDLTAEEHDELLKEWWENEKESK